MSDAPIHVDSRAWTGDPVIPSREAEVLGRRFDARERRRVNGLFALLVLLASLAGCFLIDMIVWGLGGAQAYIAPDDELRRFLAVLALFIITRLLAMFSNLSRKWIVAAIIIPVCAAEFAISWRYFEDAARSAPIRPATFAIDRISLSNNGRGFRWRKIRPEARLVDRTGRVWTLEGRQSFIAPMSGHDCMTISLRGPNGGYRFPQHPPILTETPYIDSITGKRHLSRCFNTR